MRISRIEVEKLFGLYTYDIPLNLEDHVTILIGPNGFGKTTILKMVNDFLKLNFQPFKKLPFTSFKIITDNGDTFALKKLVNDQGNDDFSIEMRSKNSKPISILYSDFIKFFSRDFPFMLRHELPNSKIEEDFFIPFYRASRKHDDEMVDIDLLLEVLKQIDISRIESTKIKTLFKSIIPDVLRLIEEARKISVHFIKTQRLFIYPKQNKSTSEETTNQVVELYSKNISKRISDKLAESAQEAQNLDNSFPQRVLSRLIETKGTHDDIDDLLGVFEDLQEKRQKISQTGILINYGKDLGIDDQFLKEKNKKEFFSHVLSVYIDDTKVKLAAFDDLTEKIAKFKEIINGRFNDKSLEITREDGFCITTSSGEKISTSSLSSGEQHELVIFYQLLFMINEGSLVLIDEPELSFHMEWQLKFLDDIKQIAEIAQFDVLVATHSMDIVNDHWDLIYDMGKNNGTK